MIIMAAYHELSRLGHDDSLQCRSRSRYLDSRWQYSGFDTIELEGRDYNLSLCAEVTINSGETAEESFANIRTTFPPSGEPAALSCQWQRKSWPRESGVQAKVEIAKTYGGGR